LLDELRRVVRPGAVGRQFVVVFGVRGIGSLVQAVSIALIARWEGPSQLAYFGICLSVGLVAFVLLDGGMVTLLLRSQARGDGSLVKAGLKLNAVTSVVAAGLLAPGALIVVWPRPDLYWVPILVLALATDKSADTCLSVFYAAKANLEPAMSIFGRRVGSLLGVLFAGYVGWGATFGYAWGLLAAALAAQTVLRLRLRRIVPVGAHSHVSLWRTLRLGAPFALTNLGAQISALDTLLLSAVMPPYAVGLYTAAAKLTSPFLLVPQALSSVILPHASTLSLPQVQRLSGRLVILFGLAVPVLGAVGLLSPALLAMVVGQEYTDAAGCLLALLLGLPFFALSSPLGSLLQSQELERFVSLNGMAFGVLSLVGLGLGAWVGGITLAASLLGMTYLVKCLALWCRLRLASKG
jgi:O-antigen/teichoic acid export membrane protein